MGAEYYHDNETNEGFSCTKIDTTPDQEKDIKAKINAHKKHPSQWCSVPIRPVSYNFYADVMKKLVASMCSMSYTWGETRPKGGQEYVIRWDGCTQEDTSGLCIG